MSAFLRAGDEGELIRSHASKDAGGSSWFQRTLFHESRAWVTLSTVGSVEFTTLSSVDRRHALRLLGAVGGGDPGDPRISHLRGCGFRLLLAALLALALPETRAAELIITGATVLDGVRKTPLWGANVLIRDARIIAVSQAPLRAARAARRIDARGKYLIPGLIDVHIHLVGAGQWRGLDNPAGAAFDFSAGEAALRGYLYCGVTSVYDAGNVPEFIYGLRERERSGAILSPRIFATGSALSYRGSWMSSTFHGVAVPDADAPWAETERFLDSLIATRPDLQKLVMEQYGFGPNALTPHLPAAHMARIVAYLKAHGVRTTIHAPFEPFARAAVAAGIDTLAHPVGMGRASAEFTAALARARIPVATTLAVTDEIVRLAEDPSYLDDPLTRAVLEPAEIEARRRKGGARYTALGWPAFFKMLMPYVSENLRRLHEAGGVLALGTDRSDGPLVHRELELLAAAGIPTRDLLKIATLNGAKFLGKDDVLGSIQPGKLADLLLLDADPTTDVANYRHIALVIKGGVPIERERLQLPGNRH